MRMKPVSDAMLTFAFAMGVILPAPGIAAPPIHRPVAKAAFAAADPAVAPMEQAAKQSREGAQMFLAEALKGSDAQSGLVDIAITDVAAVDACITEISGVENPAKRGRTRGSLRIDWRRTSLRSPQDDYMIRIIRSDVPIVSMLDASMPNPGERPYITISWKVIEAGSSLPKRIRSAAEFLIRDCSLSQTGF